MVTRADGEPVLIDASADRSALGVADADAVAVPVLPPEPGLDDGALRAGPGTEEVLAAHGTDLGGLATTTRAKGTAAHVARAGLGRPGLPAALLLVGVGDAGARDLRRAGAAVARAARGRARLATTAVSGAGPAEVEAFVEGLLLGSYSPPRTGVTDGPEPAVRAVTLLGVAPGPPTAAVRRAEVAAAATVRVRDLASTPSSVKSPQWVVEQVVTAARGVRGVEVEVLDETRLAAEGFGGLLAVGGGSATPPRLVRVSWTPRTVARTTRHVVLVGKGITFDTGGLSIKPSDGMVPMKTDMAGAAVVLATVLAAAERSVPHRVTALLALAENAVSGSAYRPGDVVAVQGGTTVEVSNTDAEGRMVLADALAWADAQLGPDVLVDVATLTGAATLGLGRRHAAMFTADDALAAGLEAAATATGERVWRMPLVEEYRASLDSDVADVRHVPSDPPPGAGSVTAALFLREFTGGRPWVHLDIAGPARAEKDEHEVTKGASGFGARLLLRWLEDLPG